MKLSNDGQALSIDNVLQQLNNEQNLDDDKVLYQSDGSKNISLDSKSDFATDETKNPISQIEDWLEALGLDMDDASDLLDDFDSEGQMTVKDFKAVLNEAKDLLANSNSNGHGIAQNGSNQVNEMESVSEANEVEENEELVSENGQQLIDGAKTLKESEPAWVKSTIVDGLPPENGGTDADGHKLNYKETGAKNDFAEWLRNGKQDLSNNPRMNCWEGVLTSAFKGGLIDKNDIQQMYAATKNTNNAEKALFDQLGYSEAEDVDWKNQPPKPGDIIMIDVVKNNKRFEIGLHVMMAAKDKKVLSLDKSAKASFQGGVDVGHEPEEHEWMVHKDFEQVMSHLEQIAVSKGGQLGVRYLSPEVFANIHQQNQNQPNNNNDQNVDNQANQANQDQANINLLQNNDAADQNNVVLNDNENNVNIVKDNDADVEVANDEQQEVVMEDNNNDYDVEQYDATIDDDQINDDQINDDDNNDDIVNDVNVNNNNNNVINVNQHPNIANIQLQGIDDGYDGGDESGPTFDVTQYANSLHQQNVFQESFGQFVESDD